MEAVDGVLLSFIVLFISFSPVPSLLLSQSTIHPIRQSPVLKFVLLHLISSDDRLLPAAVEIDIDQ
jgi:hypothetical protein